MKPAHRVSVVEDRWATVRHIVETIAIVAAGLWAFYTFIYQERIKPASEPAALGITVSLHRSGRDATRDMVVFSSTYRNTGKIEIEIAADGFDVWGVRYGGRRSRHAGLQAEPGMQSDLEDIPIVAKRLVAANMELRRAAAGGPDRNIVLEPDEEITLGQTIVLRRGEFDALIGTGIVAPVKTPVQRKVPIRIARLSDGALWLRSADPAFIEDDNLTEFALIP